MLARATAVLAALHALDTQTYAFVPSALPLRAPSRQQQASSAAAAGSRAAHSR